ncbi:MAG: hypothetical protein LLG20_25020 [Acidobacteriales bacterium]|nr:hypothetical protein [Terriglobales bacterium]
MAASSDGPARIEALFRARAGIGAAPPAPPTLRGRAGALGVAAVRRAVFWLLLQLDRFHGAVIEAFEDQQQATEDLNGAVGKALEEFVRRERETRDRLAAVEAEVERLRRIAGER